MSAQRRQEIIGALRRGTVAQRGLDAFAVGLDQLQPALEEELDAVAGGGSSFKAIRGEYGTGKTFFARWLAERAKARGFATAEVAPIPRRSGRARWIGPGGSLSIEMCHAIRS